MRRRVTHVAVIGVVLFAGPIADPALAVASGSGVTAGDVWLEFGESGTVQPGHFRELVVRCPAGSKVTNGGAWNRGPTNVELVSSAPAFGGGGWDVAVFNHSTSTAASVSTYAMCASGLVGYQQVLAPSQTVGPGGFASAIAQCPADKVALGAGQVSDLRPGVATTSTRPMWDNDWYGGKSWTVVVQNRSGDPHQFSLIGGCTQGIVRVGYALGSPTTVYLGEVGSSEAQCPTGSKVIGGGSDGTNLPILSSNYPSSRTTWTVARRGTFDGPLTFRAVAVCAWFDQSWTELARTARPVAGDFNRDGRDDLALVGGEGWRLVQPAALSNGDGRFVVAKRPIDMTWWRRSDHPGRSAQALAGDFNADDAADLAVSGGQYWQQQPLALSGGDGGFSFAQRGADVLDWFEWAITPGVEAVSGDFNRDGRSDLALLGGAGWATQPIAFANADGTFRVTNKPVATEWARWADTATPLAGDFNRDGHTDLALTGGAGWQSQPIAFSNGDGTFTISNRVIDLRWNDFASRPNVKSLAGDFNNDGRTDLALTGGLDWRSQPIAFSNGDGTFTISNQPVSREWSDWAASPNVKAVTGDFNGDGADDIALAGGAGWQSQPVAFSNRDGTFNVTNHPIS